MQTTITSISHTHVHTYLSHVGIKHYPQCKDIKINGEEKRELKGGGGGEEGGWG